jgi:hypothetical protein
LAREYAKGELMAGLKSSIAKGLIAAACCALAIAAGVASARDEAQATQTRTLHHAASQSA